MSKLETNTIDTVSGSNTLTLGSTNTSTISVGSPISNGLTLSDNILFDTASKGIYLGVTSATASNLLDDYEEGTWTPSFGSSSGSFGSLTFGTQIGRYTKIGNAVTIWCRANCTTTTIGTASGQFEITGLPFAASSASDMYAGSAWRGGGSGPLVLGIQTLSNESQATPLKADGNTVNVSDLASGGRNDFTLTMTYMTDA